MTEPQILVARRDGVCTLTLNRPQALNAFTASMHAELREALDAAAVDPAVRCVVITGAGRAFCAGQDLADPLVSPPEPGAAPKDLGRVIAELYKPLVQRLRRLPVPTVAAVNGAAAGAGANIALNCDIVLAGRSASFIQAFSKIGLIPDAGGTWLLPRLVGRARALGLAMLGDKLSGEDAERIGLVWQCVDDAELQARAGAIADRLAAMPVRALAATRAAMDRSQDLDLAAALDEEARIQGELGMAHDYIEGVSAFAARRAPRFSDR